MSSIRTKLVVFTILIVLLVVGSVSVVSIVLDRQHSAAAFEREAATLIATIAERAVDDIYDLDFRGLRRHLSGARARAGVQAAYILDGAGRVLADGTNRNPLRGQEITDPFTQRVMSASGWITDHTADQLHIGGPILLTGTEVLGFITLTLSTEILNAWVRQQIIQTLVLFGICILVGSVLATIFASRLTRPIIAMTEVMSRVTGGDTTVAIPASNRTDEVGKMAQAVDALQEALLHRTKLQAELQDKAFELETTLANEKGLNDLQRQFVSMASHEFRTPLAIIDGLAQRMMRRGDRLTPDDVQERTAKIRDAVTRMTTLIDSTLSAARLDAGAITINPDTVDLAETVAAICQRQQEISRARTISVDVGGITTPILADPGLLDQIFTNLLSNAAKYSPNDSTIEVNGWIDGEVAVVSVRDYGIGIPDEDLPRMCERFFRAGTSAGIAGTGIGLHLVKQFVEMHGGTIAVESVECAGSTFTVRLPVKPAADAIAPVTAGPAPPIAA